MNFMIYLMMKQKINSLPKFPHFQIKEIALNDIPGAIDLLITTMAEIQGDSHSKGFNHFVDEVANGDKMQNRIQDGCFIKVGWYHHEMATVLELRPPGHLAILFVKKKFQGLGLGKHLLQYGMVLCKDQFPKANRMTLNSNPSALDFYRKYGFSQIKVKQSKNGIEFIPMAIRLKSKT